MAFIVFNVAGVAIEYEFISKSKLIISSVINVLLRGIGSLIGLVSIVYGIVVGIENGVLLNGSLPAGWQFIVFGLVGIIVFHIVSLGITEFLWRLDSE